jgi:hypothetical protein
LNSPLFKNAENLDGNLSKLGRVVCIKLENPLDAIALLTDDCKLSLPLNNGTNDHPFIYPSKKLLDFILGYDLSFPNPEIVNAGEFFL